MVKSVNNSLAKALLLCAKLWHSVLMSGIPIVLPGYIMKAIHPVNTQPYCSDTTKLCISFIIHGTLLQDTKSHYVHRLQSLDTENYLGPICINNK